MSSSSNEHDRASSVAIRDAAPPVEPRPSDTSPPEANVFRPSMLGALVRVAFTRRWMREAHARSLELMPSLAREQRRREALDREHDDGLVGSDPDLF